MGCVVGTRVIDQEVVVDRDLTKKRAKCRTVLANAMSGESERFDEHEEAVVQVIGYNEFEVQIAYQVRCKQHVPY